MRQDHKNNKYKDKVALIADVVPFIGKEMKFSPIVVNVGINTTAVLNLDFLSHRPQIQQAFYEILHLIGKSLTGNSLMTYPTAIRNFSRFLDIYEEENNQKFLTTNDINNQSLINFKLWLETRPKLITTGIGSFGVENEGGLTLSVIYVNLIYRTITTILRKGRNYRPDLFSGLSESMPRWRKQNPHTSIHKDIPSEEDLKKIYEIARTESLRIIEANKEIHKSLERTKHLPVMSIDSPKPNGYWKNFDNYVHSIIRENGLLCTISKKIINARGNYKHPHPKDVLRAYFPLSEKSIVSFALQLYILTALNVTSLITLKRDCIQDFPIKQFKRLVYEKPRAGRVKTKEHIIPNKPRTSGKLNSPLEIINFLLKWTAPLIEIAAPKIKDFLFIYRIFKLNPNENHVKNIDWSYKEHSGLAEFIKHHCKEAGLNFRFNDLRPAVASFLYLKTRDIYRVQRFLGHSHIRSTLEYIRGYVISKEQDLDISNGIEQMFDIISRTNKSGQSAVQKEDVIAEVIFDMSENDFGNTDADLLISEIEKTHEFGVMTLTSRCRNPLDPPDFLKIPKGKVCSEIYKCLTCPNARILASDLTIIISRIKEIWAKKDSMSEEAWRIVHEEGWLNLNYVLQMFPAHILNRAIEQSLSGQK